MHQPPIATPAPAWPAAGPILPADLAALRARAEKTQAAWAALLGVRLRTVQSWEGGERACPLPVLQLMQLLAGVHPAWRLTSV